jgi:aspartate kinase
VGVLRCAGHRLEKFMTPVETSVTAVHADSPCEGERPPIVVIKFGGTALGTPARIRLAALRVREHIKLGFLPVVVVSAKGKTTDRLLNELRLVGAESGNPGAGTPREIDRALATGETLAAALLATAIAAVGVKAESVSASEAVLLATGPYGAARLSGLKPGRIDLLLEQRIVPVVAGFQGVRDDGELVTLGRGSSDITAVFLAWKLSAFSCHIVTDVSGVHEKDPRIAPDSPLYPTLSYQSLVELTTQGARVVHPQAAIAAHSGAVPLHIYHYRAGFGERAGTFVGNVQ